MDRATTNRLASELRDLLGESIDNVSSHRVMLDDDLDEIRIHVVIDEENIGRFFGFCRRNNLDTHTWRSMGGLRGWAGEKI